LAVKRFGRLVPKIVNFGGLTIYTEGNQGKTEKMVENFSELYYHQFAKAV